jgi:hypothetical protein
MAQSIDEFAAQFGVTPIRKPQGLRAGVQAPLKKGARKKKVDTRNLRQKIRDRRKLIDEI